MSLRLYEYYRTNSIIHKINPILKIIWLVVFSTLVFLAPGLPYVLLSLLIILVTQLLSKIPFKIALAFLFYFIVFFAVAGVLMLIFQEEAMLGVMFLLKMFIFFASAVQFTLTTSRKELLAALMKMGIPDSFAFSLTVALRFLPTIVKEVGDITDAQKTRAHKIILNIFHPVKSARSLIPIVVPLFLIIFGKSFNFALSAEARGFNPNIYKEQKMNFAARDWAVLLFLFACVYIFFVF